MFANYNEKHLAVPKDFSRSAEISMTARLG